MATQVSPKAGKHDAFITGQLGRAEKRIRLVDLAAGLAVLAAGTLLFAAVVAVLDRAFALSAGTRQLFLSCYVLAAGAYAYLAILRPMRWRVNPLYAARQIERAMPGTRNHLVNWVDLRDEKVPGVIRSSLGQRAAKDLGKVDVEEAISNRRAWVAAGGLGVMGLVVVALVLVFGPRLFGSLLGRAFAPFGAGTIAPQTQITLLHPKGGDAVVIIGNPVTVVAHLDGKIPAPRDRDAACLLYRADDSEPWRKRYMQYDEAGRDWVATVGALDVGNGFVYKLTAGDAETPEYRVTTRATPLIDDFLATYHYRPYVGRADRSRTARKLEELRGTEVQILARTNRVLKEAQLVFETAGGGGELVKAEVKADDPRAMRFRFVLDRPGKYKLRFTSAEGETYIDALGHDVVVLPDETPTVVMKQPDKDIDVPADGQVDVRGEIADDIGIAGVALRLKVVGGPPLAPVPYLADRLGKADFGTPRTLEYRELLELASLRDEAGKPFEAKAGTVLECWLEARDGCDYPKPNVGESKPKRLLRITPSKNDAAQKAEQEKARDEKKAADKKQEDDLKKQKADAEKRKEQDAAAEKEAAKEREKERAGKPEADKGNKPQEKTAKEKETEKKAEELKNKLDDREKEQGKANEKAGAGKGPGEPKDDPKPGEGKEKGGQKEDKPGAGRDEGKKDDKSAPGEKKEPGKGESGEARGGGKPEMNEAKGESKPGGDSKPGDKPGESKADQPKPGKEGASKGPGKEAAGKPGEGKPEGTPPADKQPGEAKDSEAARKPEKGKDCPCAGKDGAGKGGPKGETKPGGKGGEGKPGADKGGQPGGAKGGPPNQGDAPGTARGASPQDAPKPQDATAQDARNRADDLSRGSEQDKQAVAKDLKDIAGKAKDENARKAAQDALAKAREEFGKPGEPSDAKSEDATGDDVKELAAKARGDNAGNKAAARSKLGEIAKKAKDADARKAASDELDKAFDEWMNAAPDRPRQRERAAKSRPSAIQLEEFRKKVDPNILKDMKMSKEQFEQFLRDYADLANRTPDAAEDDDKPAGVGQAPGTLPTLGGKTIRPGKGTNDPRGTGRAKPPPEYRDARDEFLRRLNLPR